MTCDCSCHTGEGISIDHACCDEPHGGELREIA